MSEINVQPQNFNRIKSLLKFVANNKLYIVTILVSFMLGFLVSKIIRTGLFVKGGVEVFNCLIIILVIAALIYSIAYKFIINIEMRQYKYLAISFDLLVFIYYYRENYDTIMQSIKKTPEWIPKTTFVFILYFLIFILLNLAILALVFNKIKGFKISNQSFEVEFDNKAIISELKDITKLIDKVSNSSVTMYDSAEQLIQNYFGVINESSSYTTDNFNEFYTDAIEMLFTEAGIDVDVRLIFKTENNQNSTLSCDDEVFNLINEYKECIIVKNNIFDKVKKGNIIGIGELILIPICLDSIEKDVYTVIKFRNKDDYMLYFGNVVYTLIKYYEKTIIRLAID